MENLNRVTYKNHKGIVATIHVGEEMTQYYIENFEIVEELTSNEIEVIYQVKDRSERYERLKVFDRWLSKA